MSMTGLRVPNLIGQVIPVSSDLVDLLEFHASSAEDRDEQVIDAEPDNRRVE